MVASRARNGPLSVLMQPMSSLAAAFDAIVDELARLLEPLVARRAQRPPLAVVERAGRYECYRTDRTPPLRLAEGDLSALPAAKLPRDLASAPVELRLDAARVLSRTVQLPAAGRQYLDAIVAHQLERMTPWSADRVVFDYALAGDAPAGAEQVAVRLVATSREHFDEALGRLAAAGLTPALVGTSEDPLDRPSPVDLSRAGRSGRRDRLRRAVAVGLAVLALVGAGLGGASAWRLNALNAEAARLQLEIGAARQEIAAAMSGMALEEGRGRLLARKREALSMVVLLDRLSALIPTGTYLTELGVAGGELRLAGLSGDAPSLIQTLEDADILAGVHFAAPTTREEEAGRDRFEIVAQLVQGDAAPP
jgi:general secretion pathway protein L